MIDLIQIAKAATEATGGVAQAKTSGEILGTLGINWKLFVAQLINFAIILAVLWKWVFIPVAKKLQERTEKIEKSLNDADRIEKEKREFASWREEQTGKARAESLNIISKAATDAQKTKQDILQKAKEEQNKLVEQAKNQIISEKQQVLEEAKGEIAEIVTQAAEKILRRKLDDKEDKRLIEKSLSDLKR